MKRYIIKIECDRKERLIKKLKQLSKNKTKPYAYQFEKVYRQEDYGAVKMYLAII